MRGARRREWGEFASTVVVVVVYTPFVVVVVVVSFFPLYWLGSIVFCVYDG